MRPHTSLTGRLILAGVLSSCVTISAAAQTPPPAPNTTGPSGSGVNNALLYALAWKQTAAEYRALYYQGFNVARMHVQAALAKRQPGDKPLAVVTDVDSTILQPLSFWGFLVNNNMDFFEDALWDRWVAANQFTVSPGAAEFLKFCADNRVDVFYVSSRDQGENTVAYLMANLRSAGFPNVDNQHVTTVSSSSLKEPRQDEIMKTHTVAVFLGDGLTDFRSKFNIKNAVDQRNALTDADREKFGREYVIFPNPTDGQWLTAIFGVSEPPATDANREILKRAAARSAWVER